MTPFILGFAAVCAVLSYGLWYRPLWAWYAGWAVLFFIATSFGAFFYPALFHSQSYQELGLSFLYLLGGYLFWLPFVLGWIHCRRFFGQRPPAIPPGPQASPRP